MHYIRSAVGDFASKRNDDVFEETQNIASAFTNEGVETGYCLSVFTYEGESQIIICLLLPLKIDLTG